MNNPADRWVAIDGAAAIRNFSISQVKRGSKRLDGRIVNSQRETSASMQVLRGHDGADMFFDSISLINHWHK